MPEFERFILNTGRSGSTMLTRMLNENHQMLVMSDFFSCGDPLDRFPARLMSGDDFAHYLSEVNDIGTLLQRRAFTIDEQLNSGEDNTRWPDPSRMPAMLTNPFAFLTDDPDSLWDDAIALVRAFPTQSFGAHVRALFGWLIERFGKKAWLERSGSNLSYVKGIRATFPNARFVHLHRDGIEASMSMREHTWFKISAEYDERAPTMEEMEQAIRRPTLDNSDPVSRYFGAEGPPIERFGRHWSRQIAAGYREFSQLRSDQLIEVRYEELLAHPARELGRIAEFFELPDDPGWIDRAAALIDDKLGKRTAHALPQDEFDRISGAVQTGQVLVGRADPYFLEETVFPRLREAFEAFDGDSTAPQER